MAEDAKPLDTTSAGAYEKFLVPTMNSPLAGEAVDIASPRPGQREPEDQRAEFYDEVGSALKEYEDTDGIAIPLGYLVLVARL